ncbi:MAG TPA: chemotaxis protein CheW [Gaiellaceae bacterium]|jgi:chemotaxis signal transduction protein|nr:chemotaxis protein CheW [Gaiellaceae bacterium]
MKVDGVHVTMRVGNETYALPIENVVEVAEVGDVTAVPGAGPGVLGVRNLHGQVLPVFDAAHVLGSRRANRPERLLVATHRGSLAGLAVDAVMDIAPLDAEFEPADADHLACAGLVDGCLVGVVDIESIYGALRGRP